MEDKNTFTYYYEHRYEAQKKYYSSVSAKNKKLFQRCQFVLITLSALAPVSTALKVNSNNNTDLLIYFSILLSSTVAILTSVLKIFNYHENWIKFRTTLERLKAEDYYYHFKLGQYNEPDIDLEKLFVTRVETILGNEHTEWVSAKGNKDGK